MTTVVLDNSVVLSWCLNDERHALANRAMDFAIARAAVAPHIWWYELRNALVINERRGRLNARDTQATLEDIARMRIALDRNHDERVLFELARQYRLSAYDAAYLEVARRRRLPLASLDRRLREAATDCGVALLDEHRSAPHPGA